MKEKEYQKIIYLGKTIYPRHDRHKKYKTLLTHGKIYLTQQDCSNYKEMSINNYYLLHLVDDRGKMGSYEVNIDDIKFIDYYRDLIIEELI